MIRIGLLLLWLISTTWSLAQQQPTGTLPKQEIDLTADRSADGPPRGAVAAFPLFDKAFYDNQLFLLGETHGYQKPQQVDLALLKHLNQRIGVRYYIAEVDPTKAYYLNQYLQTGNDSTLRLVFRSWIAESAQWANRDFYKKIQAIRTYNQTLPARRRIRFVGIDAMQDRALVAQQLTELTSPKWPARDLAYRDSIITYLTATPKRPDSLAAAIAQRWLGTLSASKPADYKSIASSACMQGIQATLTGLMYRKTIKGREKTIFANFRDAISRLNLGAEKLYGFWGFYHILQTPPTGKGEPFAAMVNKSDLPMRGKVVSLACRYVDSYMMIPTKYLPPFWQDKGKTYSRVDKFNDNGEMMHADGIEALMAQSQPNSVTMFKLVGTEAGKQPIKITYSPFMPADQRMVFDATRPTTDVYQYVVLVRNSEMTEPLE